MKRTTGVRKNRKVARRKTVSLSASAGKAKRNYVSIEDVLGLYRPLKKPVTLRLDADVLAWFKKPGRGYQTRINLALRKTMADEKKDQKKQEKKKSGE
jgi:uncharacterized protein (DUF4415 family)